MIDPRQRGDAIRRRLHFNPNVRLDTTQVVDNRDKNYQGLLGLLMTMKTPKRYNNFTPPGLGKYYHNNTKQNIDF